MAQMETGTKPQTELADGDEGLRKRLLQRVAVAAALVVALLGMLALFDGQGDSREAARTGSARVEPVPMPIAEKPVIEEKAAEPAERKEADQPAEKVAAAEPEMTEAPRRIERLLTIPAHPHKAMARPGESVMAAPPATAAREADSAPERAARQPAAASRPIASAAESARHFLVQAGVFSNLANAEELRAKIEAAGIPAHIEARVQVGPFASRQEADQARAKLKSLGLDPGLIVAARK